MNLTDSHVKPVSTDETVIVILSTFNGGEFLQQQLDSLYAQTYPNVRILVRDDGSSDDTANILAREHAHARLELLPGHGNLGAAGSFFELLKHASLRRPAYVAFCDQDDVWLPEKLSRAISRLSAMTGNRAAMYCAQVEIVDAALGHIGHTPAPRRIGFGNALVENIAVGCSVVLNRAAAELLCTNLPARVPVHDWWCYLVMSCFGEIVFDQKALTQYRQHANNTFGVAQGYVDRVRRLLRRFVGNAGGRHWQSEQAAAFLATMGVDLPIARRQILQRFIDARSNWWSRLRLVLSNDIWRQNRLDGLAWRCLILLNRY